jgi:hypothetical protein
VPASYAEVFNYPAFGGTNVQQLSLVGSACIHQSEHVAWLTPDQNDQLGALWHSGIIRPQTSCLSNAALISLSF